MDLDKIRSMSDEELGLYLKSLSNRNNNTCLKCGRPHATYTINLQNKKKAQQKKLCSLCDSCYADLLDYLGCADILWD